MKVFLKDTAERAVKTFAQAFVAVLLAGGTSLLDVDWMNALSVAGLAFVISIFTSIGSGAVGDQSASVIHLNKEKK